jgi:hypothetical protein
MAQPDTTSAINCTESAHKLDTLLAQLPAGNIEETWGVIETTAQSLANGLRIRANPGMPRSLPYRLRY